MNFQDKGTQPSLKELESTLKSLILGSTKIIYLAFDALDEFPVKSKLGVRQQILDFLNELLALHCEKLHIVATSRPEIEITSILDEVATNVVDIEKCLEKDIDTYIAKSLEKPRLKRWSDVIKRNIKRILTSRKNR